MKTVRFVMCIIFAISVMNCSTPYQPIGALGGYSSNQLGDNTYKVLFKGNQHTKAETVFDNLLLRCAELTIEEGHKYFIIYEDSSYIDKTVIVDEPGLDDKIAFHREDNYLLNRQPEIDTDPWQTLEDQKSQINRTYSSDTAKGGTGYSNAFVDTKATNVVGVFKILMFKDLIAGFEDYIFSALEILEKFSDD